MVKWPDFSTSHHMKLSLKGTRPNVMTCAETSESDAHRRQILTSKVDPRAVRVKIHGTRTTA